MLNQLGINSTTFIQFAIFVATFFALIKLIYEPFTQALLERQKRTLGSEEVADEISKKSIELHSEYSTKAREIHGKISDIYRGIKSEAAAEYEKIVSKSKDEAKHLIDDNRKTVEAQSLKLSKELESQTPVIAMAITNKMLGK